MGTLAEAATATAGGAHPAPRLLREAEALLAPADVRLDGARAWDIVVHHPDTLARVFARGSLGLGESYVDGWWDCERIDEMIARVLRARLDERVGHAGSWVATVKALVINLQSERRAWQVGRAHYDLGDDLFEAMLGPSMAYSCAYWARADDLDAAQDAKLDLVCRKLGLAPGMRLLDIGCGWGSLMRHAAARHGVECVGLTISRDQAGWGARHAQGLPVRFELTDYRAFNRDGAQRFDRVASIGMLEHVGHRNYRAFLETVRRSLTGDGLCLLQTIGKNRSATGIDPWIERHVFPNGALPSLAELAAASEQHFVVEDVHNFGADYDRTLMAWHARFEAAWPRLQARYGERFRRLWRYYLLSCAGTFRARDNQLWQVVLSPRGRDGGYRRVS